MVKPTSEIMLTYVNKSWEIGKFSQELQQVQTEPEHFETWAYQRATCIIKKPLDDIPAPGFAQTSPIVPCVVSLARCWDG